MTKFKNHAVRRDTWMSSRITCLGFILSWLLVLAAVWLVVNVGL